eukprot:m.341079 g.341079  ORF g.341079 m.341079 type:complete len:498 (-) comp19830_c0_seq9:54-1547(-)
MAAERVACRSSLAAVLGLLAVALTTVPVVPVLAAAPVTVNLYSTTAHGGLYLQVQVGTPARAVVVSLNFERAAMLVPSATPTCLSSGATGTCPYPTCSAASSTTVTEATLLRPPQGCAIGSYAASTSSSVTYFPAAVRYCGSVVKYSGVDRCGLAVQFPVTPGSPAVGAEGYIVEDLVAIGSLAAKVPFDSVQALTTGVEMPPAAGVFGVGLSQRYCGQAKLTPGAGDPSGTTCIPDALTQMLRHTAGTSNPLTNAFGVCLGSSTRPGKLVLGGNGDHHYYTGALGFAPIKDLSTTYEISLQDLAIDGASVNVTSDVYTSGKTYVNPGVTTLSLLPALYNALLATHVPCEVDLQCTINLALDGVALQAPDIAMCKNQRCVVNTAHVVSDPTANYIGAPVLSHYYTHFDRDNRRVGFGLASTACNPESTSSRLIATSCSGGSSLSAAGYAGIIVGVIAAVFLGLAVGFLIAREHFSRSGPDGMGMKLFDRTSDNSLGF